VTFVESAIPEETGFRFAAGLSLHDVIPMKIKGMAKTEISKRKLTPATVFKIGNFDAKITKAG
jgi:hypothetical protein